MSRQLIDRLWESKWLKVQGATWGHLKARPGAHRGYMIFTRGEYGDLISIASDFEGVSSSPWFYQAQQDFIGDQTGLEGGKIYIFAGLYIRKRGDDCGRFEGSIRHLDLSSAVDAALSFK